MPRTTLSRRRLSLLEDDNTQLANLCGPLEQNLRCIETGLDITIRRRGTVFEVSGTNAPSVDAAASLLEQLAQRATRCLALKDIQLAVVEHRQPEPGQAPTASDAAEAPTPSHAQARPTGPDDQPAGLSRGHPAARHQLWCGASWNGKDLPGGGLRRRCTRARPRPAHHPHPPGRGGR